MKIVIKLLLITTVLFLVFAPTAGIAGDAEGKPDVAPAAENANPLSATELNKQLVAVQRKVNFGTGNIIP